MLNHRPHQALPLLPLVVAGLLGMPFSSGCHSPAATSTTHSPTGVSALRSTIKDLYSAFCFDAHEEPDWETQRRIYLDGAAFVPPIRQGRIPVVDDTDKFIADFQGLALGDSLAATGFHERIIELHVDVFGGIGHAFVAFEGFLPPDGEAKTRGLDSIQFVHDGEAWRLVSFTTQYENEGLTLPEDPWPTLEH